MVDPAPQYTPQPGYQPQPTYPVQPGYQPPTGYPSQPVYPPRPGYLNQPGGRSWNGPVPSAPPAPDRSWYAPAPVVAPPPSRPFLPAVNPLTASMKRAYTMAALSVLVTLGVQMVVVSIAAGVAAGLSAVFSRTGISDVFSVFDSIGNVLNDYAAAYAAVYAVGMILGIVVSGLLRRRVERMPPEDHALTAGQLLRIALIAFGMWGVGVILGNWAMFLSPADFGSELDGSIPMMVITVIGAPIFEELIFRKFLLDRLRPFGERVAIVFSALIFAMAHQNAMQFFLALLLGLLFAAVYLRTGRIRYTMALHFMINLFATLDAIGCRIFGDGFDTWWTVAAAVLTVAGVVTAILSRKWKLFSTDSNHIDNANRSAFRNWGMTLAKIIAAASIAGYGLMFAVTGLLDDNALALLHLIPAGMAIAVLFIVAARCGRKTEAAATVPAQSAPSVSEIYVAPAPQEFPWHYGDPGNQR